MLPGTRFSHKKLLCVTGDDSVKPYPSTSLPPVTFSNFSCTSTGSGADPLIQARIEEISYSFKSGLFKRAI